jgi:diphthamide synthase subunit DPH2
MRAILTPLDILSKTSHSALELGPLRVQHMPDMIVHFGLVMLGPSLQRSTLRQHSITRLAKLRVDSRQRGRRALRLRSTEPGRYGLFLGLCIS